MAETSKKRKTVRKKEREIIFGDEEKVSDEAVRKFREYQKQWLKEQTMSIHLHFNIKNDMDVLEWMKQQENKQDYIRRLIRADIARQERKKKRENKK